MFPDIVNATLEVYSLPGEVATEAENPSEVELAFDFAKGEFMYENGEPKRLTERKEIVKQWMTKVYNTQRGRWKVYQDEEGHPYGFPIEDFIGQSLYPQDMGVELIKKETIETMLIHKWIERISDMIVLQVEDRFYQRYTVHLVGGETIEGEGVI